MSIALPARYRTLALPVQLGTQKLTNGSLQPNDARSRVADVRILPYLNRDASRGSAVRTPRGLIAIAARVAHMRYVTHDVISGSDKR
jgi:hypothetical protein